MWHWKDLLLFPFEFWVLLIVCNSSHFYCWQFYIWARLSTMCRTTFNITYFAWQCMTFWLKPTLTNKTCYCFCSWNDKQMGKKMITWGRNWIINLFNTAINFRNVFLILFNVPKPRRNNIHSFCIFFTTEVSLWWNQNSSTL